MNCAIVDKKSDTIEYFIYNCKVDGNNYIGSNKKLYGIKCKHFKFLFTNDSYEEGVTKFSDLTLASVYNDISVGNRKDVNNQIVRQIREKYSIDEEFKMSRVLKSSKEWKEYNKYVNDLVKEGQKFKDKHFTREEV